MKFDVGDFEKDVVQRSFSMPVIVDFWAEWCGPCRILGPMLEQLAEHANGDWALAKLNTEELPDVAARYNIKSIPAVKMFVDGQVTTEFVGALPRPQVELWLKKSLPSAFRRQLEAAEYLLAEGKAAEAKTALEAVVDGEPGNEKARTLLARILLFENAERAAKLVRDIEVGEFAEAANAIKTGAHLAAVASWPDMVPQADAKNKYVEAAKAFVQQNFEKALQKFIEVIRLDRYYDEDGSRKACIAIFRLLGEGHELALRYRRDFSSALY